MHFLHGGKGVAFGQKATMENYLDCAFKALFRDDTYFVTGNGVQVNIRDIITIGAQTLTSFGNGLFLCAQDGKIVAKVPNIGSDTPTTLTNGQFLYANNGKVGSKTIGMADTTDGVIKAGDTVKIPINLVMSGYITTSSKELVFIAPLGKPITATAATITSGVFAFRTINGLGYTKAGASGGISSDIPARDYSPTVTLNNASGSVRIQVTNPTGWTQYNGTLITTNTPVSVIAVLTLKFT